MNSDYLKDVPESNYFRLSDGRVIRNIEELLNILKISDDALFYHHVTQERNDFAEWIKHCINHIDLYNKLIIIKDKKSFVNVLEQEIGFLKNPKISETMKFFSEDYSVNNNTKANIEKNNSDVSEIHKNNVSVSSNTINNSFSSNTINNSVGSDNKNNSVNNSNVSSILDFESFLGDIVKEINEEIFFL